MTDDFLFAALRGLITWEDSKGLFLHTLNTISAQEKSREWMETGDELVRMHILTGSPLRLDFEEMGRQWGGFMAALAFDRILYVDAPMIVTFHTEQNMMLVEPSDKPRWCVVYADGTMEHGEGGQPRILH